MHARAFSHAALTIAGSDSGGGAGLQADLKTFSALGVFGASAVTCITAQNPAGVSAVAAIEPRIVKEQIRKVCEAFPIAAAKTGMLYSADIIRAVAEADLEFGIPVLVVDPVMVAASGARLLQSDAVAALCDHLLPAARVVTPNLHEAEILTGRSISTLSDLRAAAREIGEKFDVACILKGGHLGGDSVVDVLFDEGEEILFEGPRIQAHETHGCGCAFSAAVTAYLAKGYLLAEAVRRAKDFVSGALEHAVRIGSHSPLHFFWNASLEGPF
ncbi:MAG: bifunctional hydroxymethylpyrimidine kinase/phosphomethylpyrimidine kinase [Kiritimatiellae bacterium]|nr:bifunctional hydroxymethylpyrimidine kinase/phosphomethylpyrimidine kinase [Kiritimatiellia bacterium]MDW8458931.1 bifunctional hydroxymethylpyrimidine kinase/phosphomethylpyrimidine kinase [Verrucomicrobiota bacterium]